MGTALLPGLAPSGRASHASSHHCSWAPETLSCPVPLPGVVSPPPHLAKARLFSSTLCDQPCPPQGHLPWPLTFCMTVSTQAVATPSSLLGPAQPQAQGPERPEVRPRVDTDWHILGAVPV